MNIGKWGRALIFFSALCWRLGAAAEVPPLRVISLNTVLTEIAGEVGGEQVSVKGLILPGVDPHTFEPSAADMRLLVDADLVLASGLHLEAYLDRLVNKSGVKGRVLMAGDALPESMTLVSDQHHQAHGASTTGHDEHDDELDPHWWQSIDNVIFVTGLLRESLTKLRPEGAEVFARNAEVYRQRLLELKQAVRADLEKLPVARRHLVTSHGAFGYFARDYGFTVHAIHGLSPDGEPDARHLGRLIDLIRAEKIRAIFAEDSINPKLIANLVQETRVRAGGVLYADGLGPVNGDADTYEKMYRHNVRTIVAALVNSGSEQN